MVVTLGVIKQRLFTQERAMLIVTHAAAQTDSKIITQFVTSLENSIPTIVLHDVTERIMPLAHIASILLFKITETIHISLM